MDFFTIEYAGKDGRMIKILEKIPRELWSMHDNDGLTLLHYACCGPNNTAVVILCKSNVVNVHAVSVYQTTPAHDAANYAQSDIMELLCAMRSNINHANIAGRRPIDFSLQSGYKDQHKTTRVLIANGVRLKNVHPEVRRYVNVELFKFEQGVISCRKAVLAMLHIKKAGKLWRWDKYLLREISFAIWATRYNTKWQ